MGTTRILIVDDHEVVIEGIKSVLRSREEYEIVGQAFNGREAIELVKRYNPEVVIMDISMPEFNGIEATLHIKKLYPKTRIIIYTMFSNKEYVVQLFRAGISGYVLKQDPFADLIMALNTVKAGATYFSTMAPKILSNHLNEVGTLTDGLSILSSREREVFELLADGVSIKDIAVRLFISPKTVESHKYHIMEKMNVKTITELTKIALKHNLIKIN